ncbi:FMN-binding glutamate synthase family protein [Candidatus Bathyarchaeota archaeon]|nr:MAG: FMN-binding glutamate synthase family protein [Candidatus Bathyarchaeota archaeon]
MPVIGSYAVEINKMRCLSQREPGKCATCFEICPHSVFALDEDGRAYVSNEIACVGCRLCVENCPQNAIRVRATIPEIYSRGLWTSRVVEEIRTKAELGKYFIRGFGALKPLPHFDDFQIVPAQLAEPAPLDKYREECDVGVVIGEGRVKKPIRMELPVMIAAMSYGALSLPAKIATDLAAAKAGTLISSGEGGSFPDEELLVHGYRTREDFEKGVKTWGPGGYLAVQWSTGRWGVDLNYILKADAIEIKIGQGAKPGMGGHLLGAKVLENIAKVRGIPVGTDCLSPARHMDILDVRKHLKKQIDVLKDITNYEKPVIVKLGPGRVYKDVKLAVEAGADAVEIDGKYGGTGASPEQTTQHAGLPTVACIPPAVKALKELGVYHDVKLIIMGGVTSGADVVKAIALGADAVGMASAILIAMGCHTCFSCQTGKCPMGITTQDPELTARLIPDEAAQRVANFLAVIKEEVRTLTMLSGHSSIKELSKEDLRALSMDAAAIAGVKLAGLDDYILPLKRDE